MEPQLLDDMIDALTEAGDIDPQEVRTESLRMYLNMHPALKLNGAVTLWQNGHVSLARAAEIPGLTVPEFKEILAIRGIVRETEGKSRAEMDEKLQDLLP